MESQKNDFGWRIGNRLFAHPTFPFGVGKKRSGKPTWWPQIKFEGKRLDAKVNSPNLWAYAFPAAFSKLISVLPKNHVPP